MTDGDRYVYCLVDARDVTDPSIDVTGIDEQSVEVVDVDGIGVVTHACDGLYDTDDQDRIKRWLLAHQSVVDAAGDAFGTPLPLRFDTVFEGGVEGVERWVSAHRHEIGDHLDSLSGHWEYRVHLLWDDDPFESRVSEEDPELQDLARRKAEAGAGKSYMLERQYDQRLRERKQERRGELIEELIDAVEPVAEEYLEVDANGSLVGERRDEALDQVTRLGVLAREDDEETLGDSLDDVAAIDGVTIRFTGPWPPYAFAPEFE
ncbi:MAG: hypothetical protein ACI9YT_001009 [Halobacteriales archaeon]|jgi:hypothetical protein